MQARLQDVVPCLARKFMGCRYATSSNNRVSYRSRGLNKDLKWLISRRPDCPRIEANTDRAPAENEHPPKERKMTILHKTWGCKNKSLCELSGR